MLSWFERSINRPLFTANSKKSRTSKSSYPQTCASISALNLLPITEALSRILLHFDSNVSKIE